MIFQKPLPPRNPSWQKLAGLYRADETRCVNALLDSVNLDHGALDRIAATARELVTEVREKRIGKGGIDAFMHEYELSSQEGVVLMCLAVALLRHPDADAADRLIRDKIGPGDWERHVGHSESVFVNASIWALISTGRVVGLHEYRGQALKSVLGRLASRFGEPIIRQFVNQGMRIMGWQFVMGGTTAEALDRARGGREPRLPSLIRYVRRSRSNGMRRDTASLWEISVALMERFLTCRRGRRRATVRW